MALTVRLLQNISLNTKKKIAKKEENPIAEVAKSVYRFYDSHSYCRPFISGILRDIGEAIIILVIVTINATAGFYNNFEIQNIKFYLYH